MESFIKEAPAAGFIESAKDALNRVDLSRLDKVVHELQSACWEESQNPAFVKGYLLGLATAVRLNELRSVLAVAKGKEQGGEQGKEKE